MTTDNQMVCIWCDNHPVFPGVVEALTHVESAHKELALSNFVYNYIIPLNTLVTTHDREKNSKGIMSVEYPGGKR